MLISEKTCKAHPLGSAKQSKLRRPGHRATPGRCAATAALPLSFLSKSPEPCFKKKNPEPFAISSRRKTAPRSSPPPPALPSPDSKREKIRSRMQPPQTPIPPWGSKSRRELQPSLLSPSYSRKPFQAAAAASEHPCVRTRSLFPPFFL